MRTADLCPPSSLSFIFILLLRTFPRVAFPLQTVIRSFNYSAIAEREFWNSQRAHVRTFRFDRTKPSLRNRAIAIPIACRGETEALARNRYSVM